MPLYDFRCSAGHLTERLTSALTVSDVCASCGERAVRVPVNRVVQRSQALELDSADTRSRFRLFQEASQELAANTTADIPLWEPAKARALALEAAGEAPLVRKEVTHA